MRLAWLCSTRVIACTGIAVLAVVGPARPAASADGVDVWLGFDDSSGVLTTPSNNGVAPTNQSVVSAGGGVIQITESDLGQGGPGEGRAAEYPAFDGAADGPRAVIAVTNPGPHDFLTPGRDSFVFGADINLADPNEGSAFDNGNNVIQRGLFNDAAQFKLQVDGGVASCRVKGDRGALLVKSSVTMEAGSWYRLRCARLVLGEEELLTVTASALRDGSGTDESVPDVKQGPVGELLMEVSTPLSIGGKLGPDQSIEVASDQFNGKLDNAFLSLCPWGAGQAITRLAQ
jgi:hypothetical protein